MVGAENFPPLLWFPRSSVGIHTIGYSHHRMNSHAGAWELGICHDNPMITPTEKCRYDASIQIDNNISVLEPFSKKTIPAGRYAVAYYKGMELYSNWLPSSGFEPDDYPPVAHYLNDSRKAGFVEMEVCIKLKELQHTSK